MTANALQRVPFYENNLDIHTGSRARDRYRFIRRPGRTDLSPCSENDSRTRHQGRGA